MVRHGTLEIETLLGVGAVLLGPAVLVTVLFVRHHRPEAFRITALASPHEAIRRRASGWLADHGDLGAVLEAVAAAPGGASTHLTC